MDIQPIEDLHDAATRIRALRSALLFEDEFDDCRLGLMGAQHFLCGLSMLESAAAQFTLAAYHQAQAIAAAPR